MTLGKLMAQARERRGMTKVDAAEELDVTVMTYRQWEQDRWMPDCRERDKVESIAEWCEVEPVVVLGLCGVLTEAEVSKIVGRGRLF